MLNAGFAFGVSTGSQKKELAWELIKFATAPAYQKELVILTGSGIDTSTVAASSRDSSATRIASFDPGLAWRPERFSPGASGR